jgi:hypothetical protein
MKWFLLFFLRGMLLAGPYDTQQECLAALKEEEAAPVVDQGFDNAKPYGVCFQAVRP